MSREELEHADFCIRWAVPSTTIASSLDPSAVEFPDFDIYEKMGGGRLDGLQVEEILQKCASGRSQNSVAREYHVSAAMISMIVHGKRRTKLSGN